MSAIAEGDIVKELREAFGVEDLAAEGVDLAREARTYLLSIGLSESEIAALSAKLSGGE